MKALSIDSKNINKLVNILGPDQYKHDYSFINEYLQNALDSHKKVNTSKSVELHFDERYYDYDQIRIRDYGVSFNSIEDFESKFLTLLSSDKEVDVNQVGGKGIGKISFARAHNSCIVNVYKNGTAFTCLMTYDQFDGFSYEISDITESREPNGVEFSINIDSGLIKINTIKNLIANEENVMLFHYTDNKNILESIKEDNPIKNDHVLEFENYSFIINRKIDPRKLNRYRSNDEEMYAFGIKCGNYDYPVPSNNELFKIVSGFLLNVNPSEIHLYGKTNTSRESFIFSEYGLNLLESAATDLIKYFSDIHTNLIHNGNIEHLNEYFTYRHSIVSDKDSCLLNPYNSVIKFNKISGIHDMIFVNYSDSIKIWRSQVKGYKYSGEKTVLDFSERNFGSILIVFTDSIYDVKLNELLYLKANNERFIVISTYKSAFTKSEIIHKIAQGISKQIFSNAIDDLNIDNLITRDVIKTIDFNEVKLIISEQKKERLKLKKLKDKEDKASGIVKEKVDKSIKSFQARRLNTNHCVLEGYKPHKLVTDKVYYIKDDLLNELNHLRHFVAFKIDNSGVNIDDIYYLNSVAMNKLKNTYSVEVIDIADIVLKNDKYTKIIANMEFNTPATMEVLDFISQYPTYSLFNKFFKEKASLEAINKIAHPEEKFRFNVSRVSLHNYLKHKKDVYVDFYKDYNDTLDEVYDLRDSLRDLKARFEEKVTESKSRDVILKSLFGSEGINYVNS
jgi:hypothetical protein